MDAESYEVEPWSRIVEARQSLPATQGNWGRLVRHGEVSHKEVAGLGRFPTDIR